VLARVIDAAVWGGSRMPPPVAAGFAELGGRAEWALRAGKRRQLATNVAHAFGREPRDPHVRGLVRAVFVHEAHRSADLLWALGKPDAFLASVEFDGIEHAQKAASDGRGVILAGVHLGGWELATVIPQAVLPIATTALVADDWLAWAIQHMRAAAGLRVAYRTDPVSRLGRVLHEGEALVVLGDDATGNAPRTHRVRFLDAEADLPSGVATMARLYRAPIVGFVVVRLGRRRWRVVVDAPLEPPALQTRDAGDRDTLQRLADRWSALIRAYPEQWSASFPIAWRPAGG
jgi:KDO2-lipid IV(A) lauroyltransferase